MLARLALAGLALASTACRAHDVRPAAAPAVPNVSNVRVVDAETGRPVPGAEVFGVHEVTAPIPDTFWYRVAATTDDDGWAALPPPTEEAPYDWRIVRAPGYAVSGSSNVPRAGSEPESVELHRPTPATVRVVDFLGRPVPDLLLGLAVGCGHSPDVASRVTDEDGRATFDCVGRRGRDIADLYPVGEGVQMDYLGESWDAAMDGGQEILVRPGATLRGRLLLADGSPAAGYGVGAPHRHRGPWTVTGDDGSFELMGVAAHDPLDPWVVDPSGEKIAQFSGSRLGIERTLRLPAEPWGRTVPAPTASVVITVRAGEAGLDDPIAFHDRVSEHGVPFEIWDPSTGWCLSRRLFVEEPERVELHPGSFLLEVGGGGSPYRRRLVGRLDVREGAEPLAVEHRLDPVRIARLEVSGVAAGAEVSLLTASGTWRRLTFDAAPEGDAPGAVEFFPVPAEPFGLWLATEDPKRSWRYLERSEHAGVLRARPRR